MGTDVCSDQKPSEVPCRCADICWHGSNTVRSVGPRRWAPKTYNFPCWTVMGGVDGAVRSLGLALARRRDVVDGAGRKSVTKVEQATVEWSDWFIKPQLLQTSVVLRMTLAPDIFQTLFCVCGSAVPSAKKRRLPPRDRCMWHNLQHNLDHKQAAYLYIDRERTTQVAIK
jgi:hypothetical protein